ncbi:MAG: hypothetical protein IKJ41_11900 [Clostridia bacterium]|nr:hypothetical protein [Clostridia bacterium]
MKIIGIDIGTTSICGIVFETVSQNITASKTLPNNSLIKTENSYEKIQNPEIIMNTVYEILDEFYSDDVGAIGFSGQMHGIVYTDENSDAVSPLYIWQDERAAKEYENGKSYAEHLGCFAGYGLATDFYNVKNGLIPQKAKYLCTIADYAVMKLCGNKKPLVHITNAASLGCFDLVNNKFTIENCRLPEVTAEFKAAGEYKGIPVCVALGDNQASFIGSVSDADNALINIGTGSQISWLSDELVNAEGVENRPFDGKRYLAAGCALCGGRAFAMVEKLFREIASLVSDKEVTSMYSAIDKILTEKTETSLSADCRFCGTRNYPSIRGGIYNISEENFTASDIALSVLYGMSDELYQMYKNGGKKAEKLVCSGNGIRKNAALRRVVSEMFGCEIKIPLFEEEASFGAALAASVACGMSADISQACKMIKYKEV